jgi:hypothetical protein
MGGGEEERAVFTGGFENGCAQNVVVDGWLAVKSVASAVSGRLVLWFEKHATVLKFLCGKVFEAVLASGRSGSRFLRE